MIKYKKKHQKKKQDKSHGPDIEKKIIDVSLYDKKEIPHRDGALTVLRSLKRTLKRQINLRIIPTLTDWHFMATILNPCTKAEDWDMPDRYEKG